MGELVDGVVRVRSEQPGDHAAVRAVSAAAFGHHDAVPLLLDGLRESAAWVDGLSVVAEDDSGVTGHVLLTRGLLDAPRRLVDVLVLSPLSVRPDRQRQGIGGALVRHALALAAGQDAPAVFLEGSPEYYPRFGFRPAGPLGFRRPSLRIPPAAFQVVTTASYRPWMTGTLVYPDVFWRLDCVGLREIRSDPDGAPAPGPDRHGDRLLAGELPVDG